MESLVTEALRLGFGKCALQVQVPAAGPVQSVEALAGKRIVTSFEVLAGRYFKEIDDRAGLVGDAGTTIEYVGGSVEAACALGLADGIGACWPSHNKNFLSNSNLFFSPLSKTFEIYIYIYPQLTSWVSR